MGGWAMDRRTFIIKSTRAFYISSAYCLLNGCGGSHTNYDGNSSPTKQSVNCSVSGTLVDVEVVHTPNHNLTIPASDVASGIAKTYTFTNSGSGHVHTVEVTLAHFVELQYNNSVLVISNLESGHTHRVTISCA